MQIVDTWRWPNRPSIASGGRRNRREADHLVATQRLEESLKAATDRAAHPTIDDLHAAHAGRRCYLAGWGAADERDLESSAEELICHASQVAPWAPAGESSGLRIGC